MDISVIIPTYNHAQSLKETLRTLSEQTGIEHLDYEIIVVDNNSRDETQTVVESYQKKFSGRLKRVIEIKQGIAPARNRGISEAKGRFLCFTDDDCQVSVDWLKRMHNNFITFNPDVIQGKIIIATAIPKEKCLPEWFLKERMANIDYLPAAGKLVHQDIVTANAGFKRELFDKFGKFSIDPAFCINEDTEFSRRIAKKGVVKFYDPQIVAYHHFNIDRLDEKRILRQSYCWGRSRYFLEPVSIPRYRYFFYCLKEMTIKWLEYRKKKHQGDKMGAFLTICKVSSLRGTIHQLLISLRQPKGAAL